MRGRLEPERDGISNVEIPNLLSSGFHGLRFRHDVPDRVREPIHPRSHRDRPGALCTHVVHLTTAVPARGVSTRVFAEIWRLMAQVSIMAVSGLRRNYIEAKIGCINYTCVQLFGDVSGR